MLQHWLSIEILLLHCTAWDQLLVELMCVVWTIRESLQRQFATALREAVLHACCPHRGLVLTTTQIFEQRLHLSLVDCCWCDGRQLLHFVVWYFYFMYLHYLVNLVLTSHAWNVKKSLVLHLHWWDIVQYFLVWCKQCIFGYVINFGDDSMV